MKKILSLVLALILVCSVFCFAEDTSLTDLVGRGEMILGLDDCFPPMGFTDENGDIVGFDIDLAAAVCAKLGVKLTCQPIDWDAKEMLLSAGSIDCIWNGLSITPERIENMSMTPAYANNRIVILTTANSGIKDVADLAGKYVIAQTGSFAEEVITLPEYGYTDVYASLAELKTVDEYLFAINDLANGMVDAVLIDEVVANYELAKLGNPDLITVGSLCDDLYGIAFRKTDAALAEAVYATIIELVNDGTVAEISAKWFGTDIISDVILAAIAE